jgi:hypothetical protein
VVAVNDRVAVYDRAGALLDGPTRLDRIAAPLRGLRSAQPRIVYDHVEDVFLLVFLTWDRRTGFVDVVTIPGRTADDRSSWCVLHMRGDQTRGDGKQFARDPSVGFTNDRVTVSTDNVDFRTMRRLRTAQVVSFTKRSLYEDPECDDTVRPTVFAGGATRDPDGSKASGIRPATSIGPAGGTQWLTSIDRSGRRSSLVLWRLDRAGGRLRLQPTALRVPDVRPPPPGRQCGGGGDADRAWDTGDARLVNAWYDASLDRVFAAHAVRRNPGGGASESAVRWYEVRPGSRGRSAVTRRSTIAIPDVDLAWPSVATVRGGTVFLNVARASATACLGVWGATVAPRSTTARGVTVVAGEARYEFTEPAVSPPGTERWGEHSSISRDPRRGRRVVFFNAYASGGGTATEAFTQRVAFVTSG